jgi:DNA gyrase subunit A
MTTDLFGGGRVEPRELAEEMRSSYLDYAMSVIVGRALPDVRDGLKPVHRRVLYAMNEAGLQPGRPYSKCSRVVGDVLGKYHPHGDSAVYDALVRMAQPFSLRYPLIDGQGNFGNVDGYSAAAMRYTESRLAPLAAEMLRDIDSDTVEFMPNYDERHREPVVLPSRFPNLLVNGSAGIAVGMATNVPPHNLGETIDAAVALIDNPAATVDDLMGYVKGPDFPTGGIVMGLAGIREAYETGRGRVRMRAKVHTEPVKGGKTALIITELPYMVKKGGEDGVIVKIAELVNSKVIPEIADLNDESDRSGMRVYIELKRDAIPKVVLNKLYKHTALQSTFGVNMVALVDGVPRTLGLRDVLRHYLAHQKEVVTRRTKFALDRAEKRAHVLEGYLIALDHIDEIIALIRGADNAEEARSALIERFSLTEIQAQAILDLRLRALTGLERQRIKDEHADLREQIAELRSILADEAKLFGVIREELLEIRARFADARRTEIIPAEGEIDLEQLIAEEDMVISITASGYIKRLPLSTYRTQGRGGVGIAGMDLKEGDYIEHLFIASTHDYVLFFTTVGKVYRVKVHELPLGSRQSKGRALVNVLPLRQEEYVRAVVETRTFDEGRYLLFATRNGVVKKTEFKTYDTPLKADGIIALRIREGDELVGVQLTDGEDDILLVSRKGQAVRFAEADVRPMGRDAAGVAGMRMRGDDEVISVNITRSEQDLLVVTDRGFGKRTRVDEYPRKGRGTMGVKTIQLHDRRGHLAGAMMVRDGYEVMLISQDGIVIRQRADGISRMGRSTMGVRIMNLREGDRVSSIARVTDPQAAAAIPEVDRDALVPPAGDGLEGPASLVDAGSAALPAELVDGDTPADPEEPEDDAS